MNKAFIENKVHELHKVIWREQNNLWPQDVPEPIDMLEPEIAARILGVNFELVEGLGQFGDGKNRFEVAGALNRQAGKILVSRRFSREVIRFTGAHEIGHWVLHPHEVMHRDRAIDGSKVSRSQKERDADYFAACLLMPSNLVHRIFEQTFGITPPIKIDDNIAFWLCRDEPDEILRPAIGSDIRERTLARASSFNGRHFEPLAKQFRVSTTAMAIRLKELDIVAE